MDGLITFVARVVIVVPVVATLYILWRLRGADRKAYVILLIAGGILGLVLAKIGAHLYYDPRPFIKDGVKPLFKAAHDNGFPSDHTLLASFLGFAALTYSLRWGVGLLLVAVLIGWARVAAGVHHLVDICGSFVFTGIAFLIVRQLQLRYQKPARRHKAHHPQA